ncbi:hypothetical protein [Thiomonas sp.]|jgi:hypothetical protein|uniref:hypothetical protein n=1 Tax=Thiomonas sp. TaxID=2047785 RepID=UPI002624A371|nr:hypothetical protein [Thiomonas sp.]
MDASSRKALRGAAAGAMLWGVQLVAVGVAAGTVPPLLQATLTSTASLFVLWLWTRWRHIAVFAQDATLTPGMGLGLLFSARTALLYLAVPRIGAAAALEFGAAALLLQAALPRGPRAWPAMLAGVLVILALAAALPLAGMALAACAALVWVLQQRLLRDARLRDCAGEQFVFYQLIGAAVTLPVASVVAGENWLVRPGAAAWWALAAQLGCCVLALSLLWIAPRDGLRRGPSAASLPLAAGAALALQALLDIPARWVCWGSLALLLGGAAWLQGLIRAPGAPAWE